MAGEIVQGIDCISVHVRDIHKARIFYTRILGLDEVRFDAAAESLIVMIPGGVRLTLHVQAPDEPGRPAGTITGILFAVKDMQKTIAEIKYRGGDITDPPRKMPWGTTYATVADPDGNEFLLAMR